MSITVGKSVARVDAFDKVTGRTKYYDCLLYTSDAADD